MNEMQACKYILRCIGKLSGGSKEYGSTKLWQLLNDLVVLESGQQ